MQAEVSYWTPFATIDLGCTNVAPFMHALATRWHKTEIQKFLTPDSSGDTSSQLLHSSPDTSWRRLTWILTENPADLACQLLPHFSCLSMKIKSLVKRVHVGVYLVLSINKIDAVGYELRSCGGRGPGKQGLGDLGAQSASGMYCSCPFACNFLNWHDDTTVTGQLHLFGKALSDSFKHLCKRAFSSRAELAVGLGLLRYGHLQRARYALDS